MKILWHSNAPWVRSGYGNQTALWVPRLASLGHEMSISSPFAFSGSPINWHQWTVYPGGLDNWGNDVFADHYKFTQSDVMITLCDVFMMNPDQLQGLAVAHWIPVDCAPLGSKDRARIQAANSMPIAMSRFGEEQLKDAGLNPLYVPHGIDVSLFSPGDQGETRDRMGIPREFFLVGINAVNRDPCRKALAEQMSAFARFANGKDDARLVMHSKIHGVTNLRAVALSLGILDKCMFPDQYGYMTGIVSDPVMAEWYRSLDLLSATSLGEGFGLPVIEAQACGTPVVVTDASTGPELLGGGWKVDGDPFWIEGHDAWWKKPFVSAIADAYESAYYSRGTGQDAERRAKARALAVRYDADTVQKAYWEPALEAISQWLDNRTRPSVATSEDGLHWYVSKSEKTDDHLGAEHEGTISEEILSHVTPGSVFLDVGAHVGHYSIRAAENASQVIAVEANPETYERLLENIELNGIPNIQAWNIAAWDSVTTLQLSSASGRKRDGSTRVVSDATGMAVTGLTASAMPLDDLLDDVDKITVVKLDVEGADLHVLRGMRNILERTKPVMFIEDHSIYGYYVLQDLFLLLDQLGYRYQKTEASFGTCVYWVCKPLKGAS